MTALVLLFVLGVYISLAVILVRAVPGKLIKALILAVFVLIPTWDIIPGKLYFERLCDAEAGVRIFKTVEVDPSYFRPDGRPDDKKLSDRYVQPLNITQDFSRVFHIAKSESSIQDKRTNEVLGTATDFSYYGGWLSTLVLPEGAGTTCPRHLDVHVHTAIWREVIKPKEGK